MSDRHEAWTSIYPQAAWIAAIETTHQWQKRLEEAETTATKAMRELQSTPAAVWTSEQVVNITCSLLLAVRAQRDLAGAQADEAAIREKYIIENSLGGAA